jgi:transcriptional regulator with PAS, ATPase and Fis domain
MVDLAHRLSQLHGFNGIIGRNHQFLEVLKNASHIADTKATVLIEGESGTGKELIARAIHEASSRAGKPLICINCGAVPENLLESEFFGYEKGAFTGAIRSYKGKFEAANGGTLFLDEVDELPLCLQVKFLRVLQRGEFTPLGTNEIRRSDVRVIAATNRNLKQLVNEGGFRHDLYYRLNVVYLHLPPLRERKEDLPLLIEHFLNQFCEQFNKSPLKLNKSTETFLMEYSYPGNIRELENIIQRAVLLCETDEILPEHLPCEFCNVGVTDQRPAPLTFSEAREQFERVYFEKVLSESKGVIRQAARRAGLDYKNFYMKLKCYGIDPHGFRKEGKASQADGHLPLSDGV